MTELERIEIEGFKGIESLAFEPSGINLITGRNNTGKTSVLEAINILFDSEYLRELEDNLDTLINVHSKSCHIDGATADEEVQVELRYPNRSEVRSWFIDDILSQSPLDIVLDSEEGVPLDEESKHRVLRQIADEHLTEELLSDVLKDGIVLTVGEEEYPYFYSGSKAAGFLNDLAGDLSNTLKEEFSIDIGEEQIRNAILHSAYFFDQGYFVEEAPPTSPVKLVDSSDLTTGVDRGGEEGDPIRIDDIGDFIREKRLAENLKTFTLDYLVFEEDGEKYQIPFEFMGDGFKSVVGLLWELMDDEVENEIVLIEEPENHMHPGYTRQVIYFLIQLAQEEDVQLFITTHNSDFINGFFNENLTEDQCEYLKEEFSLIRMEKDAAQVLNYETAESDLKDLHLDLRGI